MQTVSGNDPAQNDTQMYDGAALAEQLTGQSTERPAAPEDLPAAPDCLSGNEWQRAVTMKDSDERVESEEVLPPNNDPVVVSDSPPAKKAVEEPTIAAPHLEAPEAHAEHSEMLPVDGPPPQNLPAAEVAEPTSEKFTVLNFQELGFNAPFAVNLL